MDAITTVGYKANAPRILATGASILVGGTLGLLKSTPVGRAVVLKRVEAYHDYTQESQVGLESSRESLHTRGWQGLFGYRTGLAGDSGGGGGGRATGAGGWLGGEHTDGYYRTWTGTSPLYLVQTAVRNTVLMEDGTTVTTDGGIQVFVSEEDVLDADRDGFEDPYDLLPRPATRPPSGAAETKPPSSLSDGRPWLGVWQEPIGETDLHRQVAQHARELGGAALEVRLVPLLGGLMSHVSEMDDGGKTWDIYVKDQHFQFTVAAVLVGSAVYRARAEKDRLKLYRRSNDAVRSGRRNTTVVAGAAAGGRGWRLGAGGTASVSGSVIRTKATDDSAVVVTNLLAMSGERPQASAKFHQRVRFDHVLRRKAGLFNLAGRMAGPTIRSGSAEETRVFYTPLDGTRDAGIEPRRGESPLTDVLPTDVLIHGVRGLTAITDWLHLRASSALRTVRPGRLPGVGVLRYHSLVAEFPHLVTRDGVRFDAVTAAKGQFIVEGGMRLHAQLGTPHEIFHVPHAELESYTTPPGRWASATPWPNGRVAASRPCYGVRSHPASGSAAEPALLAIGPVRPGTVVRARQRSGPGGGGYPVMGCGTSTLRSRSWSRPAASTARSTEPFTSSSPVMPRWQLGCPRTCSTPPRGS